mgnify:CR=1 FL=1
MYGLKFLPGKFSRRWFAVFPAMTLAVAAVCGAFYAGLRIMGAVCAAGIPAGLVYMAHVFGSDAEYRGIVGLVSGAQLAFIFFLCGALAQMLHYLASRRRKS